ncbi:MAG: hypothetical protein ACP5UL_05215 [Thermoplasmata archaeon]
MPVAIFGGRGSGKTVFLHMLYETQVEYANKLKLEKGSERNLPFRFFAEASLVNYMGQIGTKLYNKEWPDATVKGTQLRYWFLYGYLDPFKIGWYNTLKFTVYDIGGEDVESVQEVMSSCNADGIDAKDLVFEELPSTIKELLSANVMVFLIDFSKVATQPGTPEYKEMQEYDTFMATVISFVANYKSKDKKDKKWKLYPVFVFTKFDTLSEKLLNGLNLKKPGTLIDAKPLEKFTGTVRKERKEFSEKLMGYFFRQTMALASGGKLVNVDFDKAGYFFSSMEVEKGEDGEPVPVVKQRDNVQGVYALQYSKDEYISFIEYFRDIAKDMPDEVKKEQDFLR